MGHICPISNGKTQEDMVGKKLKHTVKDFEILQTLGTGTYGKVVLCKYKRDKKKYAMKILDKKFIDIEKQKESVKFEREIMVNLSNPFLLNMKISFQDDKKLYLVSDFMQGGDLNFYVCRQEKGLTEEQARFVLAEVILALEYLHSKNIIFLDLKPENIMINKNGHVKLADFGTAKKVDEKKGYASGVAGTFEYAAPEIGQSKYEYSVDYFALGCSFFFMLFKSLLFKHNLHMAKKGHRLPNQVEYGKVIDEVNKYCKQNRVSENAKDLMKGLLALKPEDRLGYTAEGLKNLKEHEFFEGIDWKNIQNMQSPIDLGLSGDDDFRYFEGINKNTKVELDVNPDNGDENYRGFSFYESGLMSNEPLMDKTENL